MQPAGIIAGFRPFHVRPRIPVVMTYSSIGAGLLAIDGRPLGTRRAAAPPPSRSKAA
jgi:hypothetical protein